TLSNIGDVVLTLPVLSCLKENFTGAKIDVVVGPRPKEVFAKDPRIGTVFVYDKHADLKEKFSFIKKLRGQNYDMAVDMRGSLIPVLIGAKKRFSQLFSLKNTGNTHKKSTHLDILKGFEIDYKDKGRNLYIDDKDRERMNKMLIEAGINKGDSLIGISPSSKGPLKQWKLQGFVEVIKGTLGIKPGHFKVVLIGDDKQTGRANKIKDGVDSSDLVDLTGKITLNELFALVDMMDILLTCDSASLHIACDLGTKVVSIFGPTDFEEYGPTGKHDKVIRKILECSPCKKAQCELRHECMEDISAREVLDSVKKVLGAST
ncbi:MAG: glycosyltransferase family 9 protein, partial [Candidatus Omnitrophota bacterium]|nr:glycosyltransferase family 9 protein [Candidatus Omnitrophota bacterium]